MSDLRHDQSGFTLVEVLVALLIISLGVVAVLGALGVGINSGWLQRDMTRGETALVRFAEHIKLTPYVDCADADINYAMPPSGQEAGFDYQVREITYWVGVPASGSDVNFTDDRDFCLDQDDLGLQRVVINVTGPEGRPDLDLVVVKRDQP